MPTLLDKAKELGEDLSSLEKDLQLGRGVRSLEAAKQKVKEHERQLSSIQSRIQRAEEQLKTAEHDAIVRAREIIHQANQEARKLVQGAEKVLEEAQRKLAEAMGREAAVEWVKSEDARLKAANQALLTQQADAEAMKSQANAMKELYVAKLAELKDLEDALRQQTGIPEKKAKGKKSV